MSGLADVPGTPRGCAVRSPATWKQLQATEDCRRKLLEEARGGNTWQLLKRWRGTILPDLLQAPSLFCNLVIYFVLRILIRATSFKAADWPQLTIGQLALLSSFMSFFLVFYASQTYARFSDQYASSMACEGAILDTAIIARSSKMPYLECLRLVRYLNAAHILAYIGLSDVYNYENYFQPFNAQHTLLNQVRDRQRSNVVLCSLVPGAGPSVSV